MSLINLAREASGPQSTGISGQPALEGTNQPMLEAPGQVTPPARKDETLEGLTKYVPTETITLYVAGQAALQAIVSAKQNVSPETLQIASYSMYFGLAALTPLVVLLLFLGELRKAGRPLDNGSEYPWWPMTASFVAFLVWALAVPGSNIVTHPVLVALTGFGALLVSLVLSLLAPIFSPPPTGN